MNGQEPTTALLTDRYELTMLDAALGSGVADHHSVFEVFARSLPSGRRFGVFAGSARMVEAIRNFRFEADDVDWLVSSGVVSVETGEWLRHYSFSGSVFGYQEGEAYFPNSPVLRVEGTFGECVLLETVILSILNDDSAVASTAARMVAVAKGRTMIEMGSRRTNEWRGVTAARAAYVAGFDATSNLMAGRRYGVPTVGTSAHAFTLAHADEWEAFTAQVKALGPNTTLLVDTYDIGEAIERAVAIAGPQLGAIRIDSGDLKHEAMLARVKLDDLGATETKIIVSGDLDEFAIEKLLTPGAQSSLDGFGVGTKLVSGSSCPAPGFVYKLVAIADEPGIGARMRPVAKRSTGKSTVGGRKFPYRCYEDGVAVSETLLLGGAVLDPLTDFRPLHRPYVIGGIVVRDEEDLDVKTARRHCKEALSELPPTAFSLEAGDPAIPTVVLESEARVAA